MEDLTFNKTYRDDNEDKDGKHMELGYDGEVDGSNPGYTVSPPVPDDNYVHELHNTTTNTSKAGAL